MAMDITRFFREVKQESQKVTWPTWGEVRTTTFVVFVMVMVVALILLCADSLISGGIEFILGMGKK